MGQGRVGAGGQPSVLYAFKLPGVPREQYQLVYDAEGKYKLTESSPANTQEANAKGAAKRRASREAKQEHAVAAEALAGMAGE